MKLIAHRGNLYGPNPTKENSIEYINQALEKGFDVEIDLWYINNLWYLGHDEPQYLVQFSYIHNNKDRFWCHAKNKNALFELLRYPSINCFWHQEDDYTITSKNFIWVYPGKELLKNSICVMPERANYSKEELKICYGICSDNLISYIRIG